MSFGWIISSAIATLAVAAMRLTAPAVSVASEDDVLTHVRERGVVRCATIVRPGIAVPTADGKRWYGIAPDVCRAVAAAVLGDPSRILIRPYLDVSTGIAPSHEAVDDDIVFVDAESSLEHGDDARRGIVFGPAIVHDGLGVLVHASGAATTTDLGTQSICVEPGSAADRALTRFFATRSIPLHEHPFQESDEMRQAYETGNCDALAGPVTTLASVRADPAEGHPSDRVLPDLLADDPIFATTSRDERWSRVVWWTFSVLVAAEDAGIAQHSGTANTIVPGIPPAVGKQLDLPASWMHDAIEAGGNYGELYDRDLGAHSRFDLARGANALWRNGGLIYGLRVE